MPNITDPFGYLKNDHKKVAALLEKLADTSEDAIKARERTFEQLTEAFMAHAELEEECLYPRLGEIDDLSDMAEEAEEEHASAKKLIEALSTTPVDTEEWTDQFLMLKDAIEHHVQEEEGEMFPKAQEELGEQQISSLAEDMKEFLE